MLTVAYSDSSVSAYQLNGNANGYAPPENPVSVDSQDDSTFFQQMYNAPGFFSIPICGSDEIAGAMFNIEPSMDDCNGLWPCCGKGYTAFKPGSSGNPPRKVKKTDANIEDE